jgi:hypothetical protein
MFRHDVTPRLSREVIDLLTQKMACENPDIPKTSLVVTYHCFNTLYYNPAFKITSPFTSMTVDSSFEEEQSFEDDEDIFSMDDVAVAAAVKKRYHRQQQIRAKYHSGPRCAAVIHLEPTYSVYEGVKITFCQLNHQRFLSQGIKLFLSEDTFLSEMEIFDLREANQYEKAFLDKGKCDFRFSTLSGKSCRSFYQFLKSPLWQAPRPVAAVKIVPQYFQPPSPVFSNPFSKLGVDDQEREAIQDLFFLRRCEEETAETAETTEDEPRAEITVSPVSFLEEEDEEGEEEDCCLDSPAVDLPSKSFSLDSLDLPK